MISDAEPAAPRKPGAGWVGLGFRSPLRHEIVRHARDLDFVEVIADNFMGRESAQRALSAVLPCVVHSLKLNVGAAVSEPYLDELARVVETMRPPWFTDHLAFTEADGVSAGHMSPVAFTEESLRTVIANVKRVRERIAIPFALENIAAPFEWPLDEMPEHEFLARVTREAGCGILLDLENVRINAGNHGRSARDLIDALPLERILQVHVAGGAHEDGLLHDTHGAPVSEETWALLRYLCELVEPPAVLLERDQSFPPFAEILAEIRHARSIVGEARG